MRLAINELDSVIYNRVKDLYLTEINTRIDNLKNLQEKQSLDCMLNFLELEMCLQTRGKKYMDMEKRREICRANGRKGGAPKGNKNALKRKENLND